MIIKTNIKMRDTFPPLLLFFSICLMAMILGISPNIAHINFSTICLTDYLLLTIPLIFVLLICVVTSIYNYVKKGVLGEHTIEITPDYFREATLYNDDKYNWNKVKKPRKGKWSLYFRVSWIRVSIIPRREFSTTEEYNKFYDLAVSYYEQAKKAAK